MTAELEKDGGDVKAVWQRLKETDLQITEWRGTSAFVFAPTGPAAGEYIQIALLKSSGVPVRSSIRTTVPGAKRSYSIRASPGPPALDGPPAGPVYRLLNTAGGA
jgi:hypothetical protein